MATGDPLPRQAALIVNARSRKGRTLFKQAKALLEEAGVELVRCHALKDPSGLDGKVREAVAAGVPMVIVGGGDGSLSCSVDHLVDHDTVFALLPLGTANSFARTLGIPLDLPGAVGVIANGRRRRIDLGMIDGDYFANCATLGIAPLVAETVPHGLKKLLGRPGYLAWAAWKMLRFRAFALTVELDGRAETLNALEVRIANGSYHGGSELVEDADVDTGQIVVQVVEGRSRHRLIWSWAASLMKLRSRKKGVHDFTGREIRLTTEKPMAISIDGELLAHTPVTARVARGVIEVAAPA